MAQVPVPTISPADNALSVAQSGGVNSSAHTAKKEDEKDDEFGAGAEQNDGAATPSNAAVMAANDKKEEPDLDEATRGAMQVSAIDFNAGPPQLPQDVQPVFSGNDALAQMQRDQGRN